MVKEILVVFATLMLFCGSSTAVQGAETSNLSLNTHRKTDFVDVQKLIPDLELDIKYATADNFTHKKLYTSSGAFLRLGTAEKLKKVADEVGKKGYRLKIWDAYRNPKVQFVLWEHKPDPRYIANPHQGYSSHSRGSAVDLTLVDARGKELDMPTGFDCFTAEAARTNGNSLYLRQLMVKHGFKPLVSEWWHFEDRDGYQPCDNQVPVSPENVAKAEEVSMTISAVGDVTLGQDERFPYEGSFDQYYEKRGPDYFFSGVSEILSADDLTIANLEGPLTEAPDKPDKRFQGQRAFYFKGNPHYTEILKNGSVEAVDLANNHSMDYLSKGYVDTVSTLDHGGILSFGDNKPAIFEKNGVKIGLIGINTLGAIEEGVDPGDLMLKLKNDIKSLKEKTSLIIVSFHWGEENNYNPTQEQRKLGQFAIDQGADLVLGHHPHVLQTYELYEGKYIVYSLGNFVFGGNSNPGDKSTEIFRQQYKFVNGKLVSTSLPQIIPCRLLTSFRPEPAE